MSCTDYSIADGIQDKNVLGFDPYKVLTYKDKDLREARALEKAKASLVEEALSDEKKSKIYYEFMSLPMAGSLDATGNYVRGIEDYIPNSQYEMDDHKNMVVSDILENRVTRAIMESSMEYSPLGAFAKRSNITGHQGESSGIEMKFAALFDPNIDNQGKSVSKEMGCLKSFPTTMPGMGRISQYRHSQR